MSWIEFHRQAEAFASEAENAVRIGCDEIARSLYRRAAHYETLALGELGTEKGRTFDITVISAAALQLKAGEYSIALELVRQYAVCSRVSGFAMRQLREISRAVAVEIAR